MSPSTVLSWRSSPLTRSRSRRSPNRLSSSASSSTSAGPDRGERRVRLGFVELGLRQLHVAGRDVVGDHQAGDVVGQVVLGDRRCRPACRGRSPDRSPPRSPAGARAAGLTMSSTGPLIDPDALRKNVSGIVFGFHPASSTWEAKLVICATTRHGAVTGDSSSRLLDRHGLGARGGRSIAARSASSCAVVVAVGVDLGRAVGRARPTRRRRCGGWRWS